MRGASGITGLYEHIRDMRPRADMAGDWFVRVCRTDQFPSIMATLFIMAKLINLAML